ncbi:MAG: hypothetical protein QGD93_12695, partial [Actinomycetota bacterium]|nr:hypothetical protein [Actinomycetota bacterium]
MEGQFLVAEAPHLLDHGRPQNDIRAQACATSSIEHLAFLILKIFPNQSRDGRVGAQDLIDHFQLTCMLVGQVVASEEVESGKDWAHPVAPIFVVGGLIVLSHQTYAFPRKIASLGCAFLVIPQQLTNLWMGT